MSRSTKSLTLARIEDLTLGSFAFVPTSETLDHLVRYLSTWSGSDKFFMIIQYTLKLIVPFLHFRARLQHKAGLRRTASSGAAQRLGKLYSIIGDARMFFRIWGLLPIIQWLTAMERSSPPTRRLLTIERLQGWSMLVYYPLEHLYYLLAHSIVPSELAVASLASLLPIRTGGMKPASSARRLALDMNAISIWSCRFWALYVLLQFAHLREDRILLKAKEKALSKSKAVTAQAEKAELRARWDALWSEVVVNLGYLPLTIHWSLEKGLFTNETWVGIFGLIAGIASWRSGWKATALPTTAADAPPPTELGSSSSSFDMDIEAPMSLDASTSS